MPNCYKLLPKLFLQALMCDDGTVKVDQLLLLRQSETELSGQKSHKKLIAFISLFMLSGF